MTNAILLFFSRLLMCGFFILSSLSLAAADEAKVLAIVNGSPITLEQVDAAAAKYIPQTYYHRHISEEKIKEFRDRALQGVIDEELEYQEAKRTGIPVTESEIKADIERIRKGFVSKKAFEFALEQQGLTMEALKARIERSFLLNKIYEKEVASKVKDILTEDYISDYYNKNKLKFKEPEKIRLRHILIKPDASKGDAGWQEAKSEADNVMEQIKKGADFADMAWKYSKDDYRVKGGDVGFMHKGTLLQSVEDVAFGLNIGKVSMPIKSEYGYHIVKLEEKKPETQLEFREVKDKIKKELENNLTKDIKEKWLKGLKEKAKIEIIGSK